MKRIAIVHHTGELGGGTKSLVDMAMMLCDQYEIVICVPKGKYFEVHIVKKNILIHEMKSGVPYLNFFSGSSPLISRASIMSLKSIMKIKNFCKELESLKPDLILFNTIVTSVSSLKMEGIKCAFIDRETLTNPIYIKLYSRIINKNIRGAAFLCEYEKNKFFINRDIVTTIIPDCVFEGDLIISKDVSDVPDDDTYKVLFMGGSSGLKGSHIALEAAWKLDSSITMIIAGRFDFNRISIKNILTHIYNPRYCLHLLKLRKAYRRVKGLKNVLFVGAKSNIYPLIEKSDIVIFPSSKVHQPRPCIEAGYFKKPVILSDFEETKEYFMNGYNALTFRPNNVKNLVECISYANKHRDEMKLLGKHNYEMCKKLHDYDRTKYELNKFVNLILEQ